MLTKLSLWSGTAEGQPVDCREFFKPRVSCDPFGSFLFKALDPSVSLALNLYYLLPRNICLKQLKDFVYLLKQR